MIRIRSRSLPREAGDGLASYQAEIDAITSYPAKVEHAKARFSVRNCADNPVFGVVRETLDLMCRGPRRCMYCEDAPADEIEHFQPKDLYPEFVFVWKNYLYACGPCNGPKNNQFAIIRRGKPRLLDVTRKPGAPVVAPPPGKHALINPLKEDPLKFFELDLRDTFVFVPIAPPGSQEYERAAYTLRVLRLNERDYLIRARRRAYEAFAAWLYEYTHRLAHGALRREVAHIPKAIRGSHHQTVWSEMKRQHARISPIQPLFAAAPEALDW